MGSFKSRTLVVYITTLVAGIIIGHHSAVNAQRSLRHWKRDLEHRLKIYQEHRNEISDIISSSINPTRGDVLLQGPVRVTSRSNVRFSDLIIPTHSLRLNPAVAQGAVKILVDKMKSYVESRVNDLYAIKHQLASIRGQLDEPSNQFIYKGQAFPGPRFANFTGPGRVIQGTRVFRRAQFVQTIHGWNNVTVRQVNGTDVSRVIDDTYMRNIKMAVRDSKGRLFFEGRKVFYDTVFTRELESGCCGRLAPLDTSRMMLRSMEQNVQAPVLIQPSSANHPATGNPLAVVRMLSTRQLFNQYVERDASSFPLSPQRLAQGQIGLVRSGPPENFIQTTNLIFTRQIDQSEILKTLVFRSPIVIDEAFLSPSFNDGRLSIGITSMPNFLFDLSHDNYLLRYIDPQHNRNSSSYSMPAVQRLSGALLLNGPTSFLSGLDASLVNGLEKWTQFVQQSVVRIDRPTTVRGPVQFNALPAMLNRPQVYGGGTMRNSLPAMRQPQSVLIARVRGRLEIGGTINGMRIPQDIVILPSKLASNDQNSIQALKPGQMIRVHGARQFANSVTFKDFLQVNGTVNGLIMPAGVIPLHLNDFIDSVGYSNLWFLDGIDVASQLTTQSNQFDEINLSEVNGGAQSLVMKSMLMEQPDGSYLIRAPLRVTNLVLLQNGPNTGLLNGFRPSEILELNPYYPYDTHFGRKTFLAPVEAVDCVFGEINHVANWTNHLIRIDRPNTVQTVYTKLAFTNGANFVNNVSLAPPKQALVNIDRMSVDFFQDNNPNNHQQNWRFSPELYLMQQALLRYYSSDSSGGRYRVNHIRLMNGTGLINGISLNNIITLDRPFTFAGTFTMVGKVEVASMLEANRIQSNYPLDVMDLVQFDKYRIPIIGNTLMPIRLNNLVLGQNNQASFVNCRLLNGTPFNEFVSSIMSLTRPQDVYSNLVFDAPVSFGGLVETRSSLNGIKDFHQFADRLKNAKYLFEKGLQCNSVVVKS